MPGSFVSVSDWTGSVPTTVQARHFQESIDLLLRVEAAEADAQQSTSPLVIVAHGQKDAGGFAGMIRATRAAR